MLQYSSYLRNEAYIMWKKDLRYSSAKYFEKYLYYNPNDVNMWISYSQMVKKPYKNEKRYLRVQKAYLENTNKYISKKSLIRCRKILHRGIQSNICKEDKAKLLVSLGLLEVQHGNQKYGIALIEKAVYFSNVLLPVLKWKFIKEIIKCILYESNLENARNCTDLLIV